MEALVAQGIVRFVFMNRAAREVGCDLLNIKDDLENLRKGEDFIRSVIEQYCPPPHKYELVYKTARSAQEWYEKLGEFEPRYAVVIFGKVKTMESGGKKYNHAVDLPLAAWSTHYRKHAQHARILIARDGKTSLIVAVKTKIDTCKELPKMMGMPNIGVLLQEGEVKENLLTEEVWGALSPLLPPATSDKTPTFTEATISLSPPQLAEHWKKHRPWFVFLRSQDLAKVGETLKLLPSLPHLALIENGGGTRLLCRVEQVQFPKLVIPAH